ncbi:uncharacterized protein [Pocillopora verrucosa]
MQKKKQEFVQCGNSEQGTPQPNDDLSVHFLEDELDTEFWHKVRQKRSGGLSWNSALSEVHVERLIQKHIDGGELDSEDPALMMLKKWPALKNCKGDIHYLASLEQQINRFLEILLESELNLGNRYETFRDEDDKTKKTLLHYAAELGFLHVTKTLVRKCPGLLPAMTREQLQPEKKRCLLPVELALLAENDDVAAYLIRVTSHDRVQSLFCWRRDDLKGIQPCFFSFKSIIENPKMKKTVVAVLDQMINPHWPFLPKRKEKYASEEEERGIEGAWRTITENPLEYYFYYHILDGDEGGRPPMIVTSEGHNKQTNNENFNCRDKSCLHAIAKSDNKEALQHPVVRMLVTAKWKSYGHWFLSLQAVLYVIFLLLLSYSLLQASTKVDPNRYSSAADSLRGFCEVTTLLIVACYISEEINQMKTEGLSYFSEWMTLFDWLGLLLIVCIIPLRYTGSKAQWVLASLAFLFNFLRLFKFSCLTRTTGLYTNTLAKIIQQDLTRFMAVFSVIFLPYCTSLFLSLRSSSVKTHELSDFEDILWSGLRTLSEQRPIVDDYSTFNWLSILLMMAYMGTVIVILLNILIAQMSTTYIQAKKVARLEYDVDRILQLTRMERFPFLHLRMKYYKEGGWISEKKLAEELLEFREDRNPWESVEAKLNAIRNMMRKLVKQKRLGRE